MLSVTSVAQELSLPEKEVVERSLRAFVLAEIANLEREIIQLREQYRVLEPSALKQAIANQTLPGHPAWEDYIYWQNTLQAIDNLKRLFGDNDDAASTLSTVAGLGYD